MAAARAGDAAGVRAALARGADLNAKDDVDYGSTALVKAASKGHTEVVQILLAEGADSEIINTLGEKDIRLLAVQSRK